MFAVVTTAVSVVVVVVVASACTLCVYGSLNKRQQPTVIRETIPSWYTDGEAKTSVFVNSGDDYVKVTSVISADGVEVGLRHCTASGMCLSTSRQVSKGETVPWSTSLVLAPTDQLTVASKHPENVELCLEKVSLTP
jgi:hypothetical protein